MKKWPWRPLFAALLCVFFGVGMLVAHIRPTVAGDVVRISERQALIGGIAMLVLAAIFTLSAFLSRK